MGFFEIYLVKEIPPRSPFRWWLDTYGSRAIHGCLAKNDELTREDLAAHPAVFSCISLISQDIGKMGVLLKSRKAEF